MAELLIAVGWAKVKGGKWHATQNLKPSWFPRDNMETTLCGLSINPINVAWQGDSLNGGPVCGKCSNKRETLSASLRAVQEGSSHVV